MSDQEKRIVLEIFSHEAEKRLQEQIKQMDENHKAEISRLEKRIQGLHMTLYEALETINILSKKR